MSLKKRKTVNQWIDIFFGLEGSERIPKNHEGITKIKEWVDRQYIEGRITSISDEEMVEQVRIHLGKFIKSDKRK